MTTILALYGALISTVLAIARLIAWRSASKQRLTVRMFISPLVVDAGGRVSVTNDQGHPVVQDGAAREVIVVRAHYRGKRNVQVVSVDLSNLTTGRSEYLSHLPMPRTIEPDGVQLWYTSFAKEPENLSARITLVDGKTFKSPPYSQLQGFMNPLDPVAGHGLP